MRSLKQNSPEWLRANDILTYARAQDDVMPRPLTLTETRPRLLQAVIRVEPESQPRRSHP